MPSVCHYDSTQKAQIGLICTELCGFSVIYRKCPQSPQYFSIYVITPKRVFYKCQKNCLCQIDDRHRFVKKVMRAMPDFFPIFGTIFIRLTAFPPIADPSFTLFYCIIQLFRIFHAWTPSGHEVAPYGTKYILFEAFTHG